MGIHLNTQHLAEILSLLIPKPGSRSGSEKRRSTRIHVEAPVTIWHIQNGAPGTATSVLARDLSFSGIGFLQTTVPTSGGQFMLRLPRAKSEPVLLLCRVTFIKLLADSLYVVGAEFLRVLSHQSAAPAADASPGDAKKVAQATAALCERLLHAAAETDAKTPRAPAKQNLSKAAAVAAAPAVDVVDTHDPQPHETLAVADPRL